MKERERMKDILTVKELPAFQKPELYPVLDEFFRSYLVERDIEKTLAFVTEDVYSIGTGENEVAVGREQLEGLLRMEIEAMPEPIAYQILEYREKPEGEDAGTCFCQVRTTPERDLESWYFIRLVFLPPSGEWRADGWRVPCTCRRPAGRRKERSSSPCASCPGRRPGSTSEPRSFSWTLCVE